MIPTDKTHIAANLRKLSQDKAQSYRSLIIEFHENIPTATIPEISTWLGCSRRLVGNVKKRDGLKIPLTTRHRSRERLDAEYKPTPIKTASSVTRRYFELVDESGINQNELTDILKLSKNVLSTWRTGKASPSIFNFELAVEALGYKLEIVKK